MRIYIYIYIYRTYIKYTSPGIQRFIWGWWFIDYKNVSNYIGERSGTTLQMYRKSVHKRRHSISSHYVSILYTKSSLHRKMHSSILCCCWYISSFVLILNDLKKTARFSLKTWREEYHERHKHRRRGLYWNGSYINRVWTGLIRLRARIKDDFLLTWQSILCLEKMQGIWLNYMGCDVTGQKILSHDYSFAHDSTAVCLYVQFSFLDTAAENTMSRSFWWVQWQGRELKGRVD